MPRYHAESPPVAQEKPDFNAMEPDADGNFEHYRRTSLVSGDLEIVFGEIEWRLIRFIESHDHIVGCMAWLTSFPVLRALAKKTTAIVVQKEDFLRPDSRKAARNPEWTTALRRLYGELRSGPERHQYPAPVGHLSVSCFPELAPVRCVGFCHGGSTIGQPRMHHKFLVGCGIRETLSEDPYVSAVGITPREVWTGSFNASETAGRSFENAVVIRDPAVAAAYLHEFGHVLAFSEPLDWTSEWVEPEWRIGT